MEKATAAARPKKDWLEDQFFFTTTDQLLREICLQLMEVNEKLDGFSDSNKSVFKNIFGLK